MNSNLTFFTQIDFISTIITYYKVLVLKVDGDCLELRLGLGVVLRGEDNYFSGCLDDLGVFMFIYFWGQMLDF